MPNASFAATLLSASFQNIPFPVSDAETTTSHDGVGHKAYRVAGADFEPTGLNEDQGTLTVPLYPGVEGMPDLYPQTYRRLLQAIRISPIGDLVHPTRGRIRAFVSVAKESLSGAGPRDGITLVLSWAEHNGNTTDRTTDTTRSPVLASRTAVMVIGQRADSALLELFGALLGLAGFARLVLDYLTEQFDAIDSGLLNFTAIQGAFARMRAWVEYDIELASVREASAYDALAELTRLASSLVAAEAVYLPRAADRQTFTVVVPMSVWEVAEAVYGNASTVGPLFDANPLPDPMHIAAGTVLVILPDPALTQMV